jgi:hypothetical protein
MVDKVICFEESRLAVLEDGLHALSTHKTGSDRLIAINIGVFGEE